MNEHSASSPASELIDWLAMLAGGEDFRCVSPPADELRQARALVRSLVDSLPLNLVLKDAAGRRVFANRRYLQTHQTQLDQIVGKTDADLFPPEMARKFTADDARILQSGCVLHDTEEHQTPDGQRRWIERIKGPLYDADGRIVGVQVLFWDITDRRQAEDALECERYLLHSLMDNIPDAIYFKDDHSRFLRISRAQAGKFGLEDPQRMVGKTDADIFTPEHAQQALADEREIMTSGQPIVGRVEKETWPDQEDTWVSTTKMPLRDSGGRIVGTFGISRDITELKRTQDELRAARDAADAASRAKSDFLANMSHEIRTPMNAIIGMTELLLDTNLSPTQREYLRMVQASGDSLLGLLNDILDFSKIEAGRLTLDYAPFDIRNALGDTLKSLAVRAHNKGLELAFDIEPDVPTQLAGDVGRLRQIVVNLVGNAIKFTERGEVVLNVRCQGRSGNEATLLGAVRDTGIGIPPDRLDRIFQEFEQADTSTTRAFGGTGLGLAIASRLADLMGGEIWVQSQPGRGSTFYFTARFGIVDATPQPPFPAPLVSDVPVLIVDDNATNRRILFDMLTGWGMKPALATGAREALEHLQQAARRGSRFRLALLDVNMPQVDGFELAAWIRGDPALADTPLLMLTSASRPGDAQRRDALAISAHLLKPVKQSELFEAILAALGMGVPGPDAEAGPAICPAPQFEGLRVLLAEDNLVNQRLAVGVLNKLGCQVRVAASGRQAIAEWEQQEFDVVLMDVQMPELDGLEATRAIRGQEAATGRHTPIIAMTAHAMTGDRQRCLEAGMDDYLAKPVRIRELSDKLDEVLQPARGGRPACALAHEPPVNWTAALEAAGNDRELLQMAVVAFLEESDQLLPQVRAGVRLGDAALLGKSAYALKAALLTVGARPASILALELERMGRCGDLRGGDEALAALDVALDKLLPVLSQGPPAG